MEFSGAEIVAIGVVILNVIVYFSRGIFHPRSDSKELE